MPASTSLTTLDAKALLYAVQRLISERKVTPQRVLALAQERSQQIAEMERELAMLRGGHASSGRRGPGRPPGRAKAAPKKKKRKFTMTPKARAARKIQGRYLGLLKGLKGAARAKVKALAKKESVAAAVKMAEKLGR